MEDSGTFISPGKQKLLASHVSYSEDDKDFFKKNQNLIYRTSNQNFGAGQTDIKPENKYGLNGKFTTKLQNAGMYRNGSLNTAVDRDRYLNGAKDWVDHLG
mmetsp:Transcript_102867/g.143280  ORF Transcript_102867/g.143280 Transcript_102867/m.143280 type:complete len:101 (-) Transcript_102867:19-321(-)